jgi:hypothetical protein
MPQVSLKADTQPKDKLTVIHNRRTAQKGCHQSEADISYRTSFSHDNNEQKDYSIFRFNDNKLVKS